MAAHSLYAGQQRQILPDGYLPVLSKLRDQLCHLLPPLLEQQIIHSSQMFWLSMPVHSYESQRTMIQIQDASVPAQHGAIALPDVYDADCNDSSTVNVAILGKKHCKDWFYGREVHPLTAVSWGTLMRIRLPSLLGFMLRSEVMMAFSMLGMDDLSYG